MKTAVRTAETEADLWTGILYPDGSIPPPASIPSHGPSVSGQCR